MCYLLNSRRLPSRWTPSIARNDQDQTAYLVADDFGKHGRAWQGSDCEIADLKTQGSRISVRRDLTRSGMFSCEGSC
jgi:hypothetical protein